MKRLFIILVTMLGPAAIAFGQEDSTKVKQLRPRVPLTDSVFSTHPMPNGYRGDNCVSMPNAYRGDNCVPIPNAYIGPFILRHPTDSTAQLPKKYGRKWEEKDRAKQLMPN